MRLNCTIYDKNSSLEIAHSRWETFVSKISSSVLCSVLDLIEIDAFFSHLPRFSDVVLVMPWRPEPPTPPPEVRADSLIGRKL